MTMELEREHRQGDKVALRKETGRTNLQKLVAFAEELDEDGTLIPAFLALLEVCFQGQKHSL